jgi:hypothetical protein
MEDFEIKEQHLKDFAHFKQVLEMYVNHENAPEPPKRVVDFMDDLKGAKGFFTFMATVETYFKSHGGTVAITNETDLMDNIARWICGIKENTFSEGIKNVQ